MGWVFGFWKAVAIVSQKKLQIQHKLHKFLKLEFMWNTSLPEKKKAGFNIGRKQNDPRQGSTDLENYSKNAC